MTRGTTAPTAAVDAVYNAQEGLVSNCCTVAAILRGSMLHITNFRRHFLTYCVPKKCLEAS